MSASSYAIAALVITGVASTAGLALSHSTRAPEALVCELRLTEAARHVTLSAEAEARQAVRGTYQLDIDQRSSGGRSTIRQGGEFDLRAGERAVLGEASFSGRARDLDARLSVTSNGQTKTCRATAL